MKVLSLFDGISSGRLALERAGIPVEKYYASEIDKYAIQVAQKNYPDTIQVGGGAKTGLYKVDLPDGDYIIRKLTPVECARLQTMPDHWCDGISATQQYKCYGNGWTVDVIAHILKQIPTE